LVSTNSIRGGANRTVLDNICKTLPIFEAWSDEDWFDNGAAVRVSLVCFGHNRSTNLGLYSNLSSPSQSLEYGNDATDFSVRHGLVEGRMEKSETSKVKPSILRQAQHERLNFAATIETNTPMRLNGQPVALIHADLTAGDGETGMDLTTAKPLKNNKNIAFQGTIKTGAMDVSGELARHWLKQPNPNGKPNSQVIRPWANGMDITRRSSDTWIIDFGVSMSEVDASLFELPFEYANQHIKPMRVGKREEKANEKWWLHQRPRPELRKAIAPLERFICTPRVSKYRLFIWFDSSILPDCATVAIARADDTTFGILHSRFHELWSLGLCTWLGKGNDPRYTPTTCFETFPFPTGLTPSDTAQPTDSKDSDNKTVAIFDKATPAPVTHPDTLAHAQAIAEAAFKLNQLRENWLNPTEWVQWVITDEEQTAGFPKRPKAKAGREDLLKKRTLTNLYNDRPSWLNTAHQTLDKAVAHAYGWTDYTPETTDADILQRLLKLNLARSQANTKQTKNE
jgi:hypothetical protein